MKNALLIDSFLPSSSGRSLLVFVIIQGILGAFCNRADADDPIESIYQAAMANMLAVENYDVIIRESYRATPTIEEDKEYTPIVSIRTTTRQVFDRKGMRCFHMNRMFVEPETDVPISKIFDVKPQNPMWQIGVIESEFAIIPTQAFSKHRLEKWPGSFDAWLAKAKVPRVETFVWHDFKQRFAEGDFENSLENLGVSKNDTELQRLANGTVVLRRTGKRDSNVRTVYFLEPSSMLPSSFQSTYLQDGKPTLLSKSENRLEQVRGVYRLVSSNRETSHAIVNYERVTKKYNDDARKRKQAVPMELVGTLDIEWLQFNEVQLKFPTLNEIGEDRLSWGAFMKLDSDQMEIERRAMIKLKSGNDLRKNSNPAETLRIP